MKACVILAWRKGMWRLRLVLWSWFHRRASKHLPSVINDELIATLSFNRRPEFPVRSCLSLPARSTNETEDIHSLDLPSCTLIMTTEWLLLDLLFIPVAACLRSARASAAYA